MTIHWTHIVIGSLILIVILKMEHWIRRRYQRRCSRCGSLRVRRIHKMHVDDSSRPCLDLWKHYQTFTFTTCRNCRLFRLAKSEDRCFSVYSLRWRQFFHRNQFEPDDELFKKAGLDSHPLSFILREKSIATLALKKTLRVHPTP